MPMRQFKVGEQYRFVCPSVNIEFYNDINDAWEQQGENCYYPSQAVVTFLGIEEVNGEPYNRWLHAGKTVYINFCDDAFAAL